jgi:hypothetical protein
MPEKRAAGSAQPGRNGAGYLWRRLSMAQAIYGAVAIGGTTARLTIMSGWFFARSGISGFCGPILGPGFCGMASLCCARFPL